MQPVANPVTAKKRSAPPELLQTLREQFRERFSSAQAVRDHHGRDASPYETIFPDCVVFAATTAEVADVVRLCARYRVPLIAFGAGTSVGSSRVDLQACKLEYSIVSPK